MSVNTFAGFPLYSKQRIIENRERFRRDEIPELALANSLYISAGQWPAHGWLLLRRSDYNQINQYSTTLQLVIKDVFRNLPALTFNNLSIVQARCVSRGLAADPNAIYLVEVTDGKGVLWNRWFAFPTTSQYNVRAPAYPEQFYSSTLSSGAAFSWNQMVSDLWTQMGTFLGPYPGLPIVPTAIPEDFKFPGQSAWDAMVRTLEYIGCTVSTDLTLANPYGIASIGATDTAFNALIAKYVPEDDLEYIDTGAGRVPNPLVVYFHRRNQYYGTEETVRRDSLQWSTTPLYQLSIAAPAKFSSATGTGHIWADFTLRYDIDGNPLAADTATAQLVAAERATQYFNRIYRSTIGFLKQVYAGAIGFATGSQVDGVCWRERATGRRLGWETVIVRGPDPPFDEVAYGSPGRH